MFDLRKASYTTFLAEMFVPFTVGEDGNPLQCVSHDADIWLRTNAHVEVHHSSCGVIPTIVEMRDFSVPEKVQVW